MISKKESSMGIKQHKRAARNIKERLLMLRGWKMIGMSLLTKPQYMYHGNFTLEKAWDTEVQFIKTKIGIKTNEQSSTDSIS